MRRKNSRPVITVTLPQVIAFVATLLVHATLALSFTLAPMTLGAQTRGFLVRLGDDTIAVERFTTTGSHVEGTVVRHTPSTTVLKYALTRSPDGSVASYEEGIFLANGTPAPAAPDGVTPVHMRMTFAGDSVTRVVMRNGESFTVRNRAPRGTLPSIGGTSPFMQEVAVQLARRNRASSFGFFTFALSQDSANVISFRAIGPDSAEIAPGGFRRGYRLDRDGRLLRGDGSLSTLKVLITPLPDADRADLPAIATAWTAKDVAGTGFGIPSIRDTLRATVGSSVITIDYGRPAKRGRRIWGTLVPFDTVWRFGANAAAQLKTEKALDIGGATVPAGSYTLWLLPSAGQSYLIVNSETGQWGTAHDASKDVVKIPISRHSGAPAGEERFRVLVQDGTLLMLWDDGGYEVAIKEKGTG